MVKARWVICMMWHVDNITLESLEALEEFRGTLCVIMMVLTMEIKPLLLVGALELYGVFDVLMNKSLLSS